MSSTKRSFGWIQNPGDLTKLMYVAGIFVNGSDSRNDMINHRLPLLLANNLISTNDYNTFVDCLSKDQGISYSILKGRGCGSGSRKDAVCTGLIQAALDAQSNMDLICQEGTKVRVKKPYVDDWSADGYLRWAVCTGLVAYNRDDDTCTATDLGKKLSLAKSEKEIKECLKVALMSYPPVYRILSLLSDGNDYTKFELGAQLGFTGEMGFTSLGLGYYLALLNEAITTEAKKEIKSNVEGDSDKYARMIAGWLIKMGWVEKAKNLCHATYYGKEYEGCEQTYKITATGRRILEQSTGHSSRKRIPKIVQYEMLATKAPNAGFLRLRRALIIESLIKPRTIEQIVDFINSKGLSESETTIKDDIKGLQQIGLNIILVNDKYSLKDCITGLVIPKEEETVKGDITILKDKIRENLHLLNHDYLILVDLAYSDASTKAKKNSDAREFELKTTDLLVKELGFSGTRLGETAKPDIIIWNSTTGCIIDNKSYKDGLNIGSSNGDEMCRYVQQAVNRIPNIHGDKWWSPFTDHNIDKYTFLFVTSFLKGKFRSHLEQLSQMTNVPGAAINVMNLLLYAENVKSGNCDIEDFGSMFNNDEISFNM